jgi:putative transposase
VATWRPAGGAIRVVLVDEPAGWVAFFCTDTTASVADILECVAQRFALEEYHRGLKQFTGVERCQVRAGRGQRNHIGCAVRAFVRLEYHRFTTGVSWFAAKWAIVRGAVREYLRRPLYRLPEPATA